MGGVPLIKRIATEKEKLKPVCILPFALGLFLVVGLYVVERLGIAGMNAAGGSNFSFFAIIIICSFFAAVAMVMPGISGAFVLVAFGVYDMFMEALKNLDMVLIVPAVIGILAGIIVGAKLILLVLKKYTLLAYSAIMGMVVGSVLPLIPGGLGLNVATFTGIVCLALGAWIALVLGKREVLK